MIEKPFNSFFDVFLETFSEVYRSDSYNSVYKEFNGLSLNEYKTRNEVFFGKKSAEDTINEYRLHPITLITSFFGLPNQWDNEEEISVWKILKNLAGWQDYKSRNRNIFNWCKMPFVLPWNIAMAILTTAHNTIRLATEFLPALLSNTCKYIARLASDSEKRVKKNKHDPLRDLRITFFSSIKSTFNFFHEIFDTLYFIGKAITSPIKGITSAWHSEGYFPGYLKAALSLVITVVAYTILLPFVPVIAAKLGLTLAAPAASALTTAISSLGSHIVLPLFGPSFAAMGASLSPFFTGLSLCAAAAITTVGPLVSRGMDWFYRWWKKCGNNSARYKAALVRANSDPISPEVKPDEPNDHRSTNDIQSALLDAPQINNDVYRLSLEPRRNTRDSVVAVIPLGDDAPVVVVEPPVVAVIPLEEDAPVVAAELPVENNIVPTVPVNIPSQDDHDSDTEYCSFEDSDSEHGSTFSKSSSPSNLG